MYMYASGYGLQRFLTLIFYNKLKHYSVSEAYSDRDCIVLYKPSISNRLKKPPKIDGVLPRSLGFTD